MRVFWQNSGFLKVIFDRFFGGMVVWSFVVANRIKL
jgi:hypothetical protein